MANYFWSVTTVAEAASFSMLFSFLWKGCKVLPVLEGIWNGMAFVHVCFIGWTVFHFDRCWLCLVDL